MTLWSGGPPTCHVTEDLLGDITENGVKYQLAKLKKRGLIRRIGPDKGGRWEILK
jgi:ATP-dependent DNA helicase RecG